MNATSGPPGYPGAEHDHEWRRLVFPDDYRNPAPKARYHLVVIGAGPAGLVAAMGAAGLGARVALVESTAMGGDCLNVGCVPSKSLLAIARHGSAGFDDAFQWLRQVRARIAAHDSVERFSTAGIDVFLGSARFTDRDTVGVGSIALNARRFVIATGAHAALPAIPGLAESAPHTNETLFDLTQAPRSLAILGAGAVGCELAQAFARLGVTVDLIEAAERVLPASPAEASDRVAASLRRDGVKLHTGVAVRSVERGTSGFAIHTDAGTLASDELLVAAGRRANTAQLNLAAAAVQTDQQGRVTVDRHLRTSARHIFAAGDVCTAAQYTHHADAQARIVVQNALFAPTARADRLIIPRCIYTDPEVAEIGRGASALEAAGIPFDRFRVAFADLDRGRTDGAGDDYAEVFTRKGKGTLLGATLVGSDAGEQIAALCMAMTHGLKLGDMAKTVLPYPTRSEYLRRLGDEYNRTRLTPITRRLFSWWFDWRR